MISSSLLFFWAFCIYSVYSSSVQHNTHDNSEFSVYLVGLSSTTRHLSSSPSSPTRHTTPTQPMSRNLVARNPSASLCGKVEVCLHRRLRSKKKTGRKKLRRQRRELGAEERVGGRGESWGRGDGRFWNRSIVG